MRKTFKYRLYPTKKQADWLTGQLAEACRLYNAALQERRDAWRMAGESIGFYDQDIQLKEIRASGDVGIDNFQVASNVLRRVDVAFQSFFRRAKGRKGKAGFPRFKSASRYDSITFPSHGNGCKLLDNGKLRLQGGGQIKLKLHRPIEGKIKTINVKREAGKWFASFSVECEAKPLPESSEAIGIDLGLLSFATLSDGQEVENPRYFKNAQAKLRRAQRKVARRKKGSHRRKKAVQVSQKLHAHVRNQRADFHHKISRTLVNCFGVIAVEDLNVKGLAAGMLAKSVNDAGWTGFIEKVAYKAESAGRKLIKVNPRGTSQTCLCGADVPKTLSQRWHECNSCGLSAKRDLVSAQLILRLGLSLCALTYPAAERVAQEAVLI